MPGISNSALAQSLSPFQPPDTLKTPLSPIEIVANHCLIGAPALSYM